MRIGFDAKRYFFNKTGLGNYSRDLIRMLEYYHPEHTYIKYTNKLPQSQSGSDNCGETKTPVSKLDILLPSLWRQKGIVKDLRKDKIDIFHGLSGEIPIGLQQTSIKSVVTIHDLIFLQLPQLYKSIDRILYNHKFKHACIHSDKIIAISHQTKNDIVKFYNVAEEKIEVIYQGCHPAFKIERTEAEKDLLRDKYNLPQNFILNVGSIEPRKNALQIVKAIKDIDIPLLIIGKETKYADEIKKYIQAHHLQNRVFIRQGFTMEELATIYAMAKIFVYPSQYEGFGIPIIEALYSGTPVITNKFGVFPEAGGPHSCYVDPENVEELHNAISSILADSELQLSMKKQGLTYVQRFNDENIAKQMNKLYEGL